MRLQAFLARAGAAPSRRKAEALIEGGRVTVDGETASIGASVSGGEEVLLDGRRVLLPSTHSSFALNKPAGYLTTLKDEPDKNRPTVAGLMPDVAGLVPAGRLDAETTGLLILTNDGPLAHRITHPSSQIEKEYRLTLNNPVPASALETLAAGPLLKDGPMSPPTISNRHATPRHTTLNLTIHEGRNRIIRRACAAAGLNLVALRRVRVGPVLLGDLAEGEHRPLTEDELGALG
ncbi:MAG: Ribosomal large subunit pseudouridine synthase B [uncultured Rubrobacteraceae bacterium]|uniref:Pseudouridine synthase n=1 Tax=uncultured Rubrobacteraceae bacterium TaxID=349277 RepID=A0A6J4PL18_9ACTN|nr:MAG: Ribosomal large subunit pseudouridine synthase B [uncultured Rubrobacteraceae bacterium]